MEPAKQAGQDKKEHRKAGRLILEKHRGVGAVHVHWRFYQSELPLQRMYRNGLGSDTNPNPNIFSVGSAVSVVKKIVLMDRLTK